MSFIPIIRIAIYPAISNLIKYSKSLKNISEVNLKAITPISAPITINMYWSLIATAVVILSIENAKSVIDNNATTLKKSKFLFIRIFAGLYLIYLFFSNFTLKTKKIDTSHDDELSSKDNRFDFLKVVALLSITDLAFSIDSITTAVAISDQYVLIIIGALIGVIALRFTSEVFLRLLEYFIRLEMAGYVAILIIGIKLILNTLVKEIFLPDYYFYILIFLSFVWGLSKKK